MYWFSVKREKMEKMFDFWRQTYLKSYNDHELYVLLLQISNIEFCWPDSFKS